MCEKFAVFEIFIISETKAISCSGKIKDIWINKILKIIQKLIYQKKIPLQQESSKKKSIALELELELLLEIIIFQFKEIPSMMILLSPRNTTANKKLVEQSGRNERSKSRSGWSHSPYCTTVYQLALADISIEIHRYNYTGNTKN